ncbi:MAG: acyl-CoA synthetase [Woeseiaceae bacterium]|nr:acyl-CoA synthetase [Woeseiaceae bacterium]
MGLRKNASEHSEKTAILMAECGTTLTYGELSARADQYARFFRRRGLRTGDGIAFTLENCSEFYAICFGALRAGLYYTALSTYLTPAETHYIVTDCGARLYISSAKFGAQAETLDDLLPGDIERYALGGEIAGYAPLEREIAAMPAKPIDDESKGQDLLYSSGTTGQPKGVKIALTGDSPEVLSDNARAIVGLYGFSPDTVYLSPAPLYHAAPLRFNLITLTIGGTSVIMRRFDPVAALQAIETHRCTHSQWVPTMFIRMLKLPDAERLKYDVSSMQVAIHAAAPCPVPVKERMIEWWGPVIYEYYAGTEGSGFCTVASKEWLEHRGTVGRPLFGAIHIVDEDGRELGPGEIGTIYFSGGTDFEYLNDPVKTRNAHNEKGWSTLGDIGYTDDEGFLYLTDRKAYMIISGGVNIYPQECEDVLVMHPQVADAAVFGIPDPDLGERVKAVVQLLDPADAGPELAQSLLDYCRQQLSPVKCPKSVDFVDSLPRQATGKLYKRLLQQSYASGDAKLT